MRKICPITYELIADNEKYSPKGLKRLSAKLTTLKDLNYSAAELVVEARIRAQKMSLQGVQPKVIANLDVAHNKFIIVDRGGKYILKPQNPSYHNLPENEDLSMRMASTIGIEVPLHGLLYSKGGEFTYFIKRFDRIGHHKKVAVEDFAQLSNSDRETKYKFSMEKIIPIIDNYTTFPAIEKANLFLRVIFNYLIGNEDMHLKNYALITRDSKTTLAPAYDFINSTIAIGNAKEEIALSLNGKKNNLSRRDLIDYFGYERLGLKPIFVEAHLSTIIKAQNQWFTLIDISFLPAPLKEKFQQLLVIRLKNLGLY